MKHRAELPATRSTGGGGASDDHSRKNGVKEEETHWQL